MNTPTVFIPSHQGNGPNISSVFKPILSASGTNITSQCQDNVDTCCKENGFSGNGNSVSTPLRFTLDSNCSNDLLSFSNKDTSMSGHPLTELSLTTMFERARVDDLEYSGNLDSSLGSIPLLE